MKNRIFFSYLHPSVSFFYFAFIIIFTMFSNNPVLLLTSFCGALMFFLSIKSEKSRELLFVLVIFIVIAVSNPLFSHNGNTVLFYIGDNAVSVESLLYGLNTAVMISAVIVWFKCFNVVMTDDKTEYLFSKIMPKLSLVIIMALRYIPLYRKKAAEIRDIQKGMGYAAYGGFVQKLRFGASVYLSLVTWSLENSVETGMSMKARGYGNNTRTNYSLFRFETKDVIMFVVLIMLSAAFIICSYKSSLDFVFYPVIGLLPLNLISITAYICFAVTAFIPVISETTENIKWKFYLSKN